MSLHFFHVRLVDYGQCLVILLRTSSHREEKYDTNEATTWGVLGWLTSDVSTTPLANAFTQASAFTLYSHFPSQGLQS